MNWLKKLLLKNSVLALETEAEKWRKDAVADTPLTKVPYWKKIALERFEDWYTQLKERDKYNEEQLLQHAQDLRDYMRDNSDLLSQRDLVGVANDDLAAEDHRRKMNKLNIALTEIEKRFANQLGLDFEKIMDDQDKLIEREHRAVFK